MTSLAEPEGRREGEGRGSCAPFGPAYYAPPLAGTAAAGGSIVTAGVRCRLVGTVGVLWTP